MQKKVPMRICLGCHEARPKQEMIRVVKTEEQTLRVDWTGKQNGRGAYLCNNPECVEKAFQTGGFMRSFKMKISKDALDALKKELGNDR